jgi:pseudouridine-5'-phosphate glycosidase
MNVALKIHPEVQEALSKNQPVVALESTIISHGMPYPENIQTAKKCEDIIREHGAVPATIAIIDGIITVGLTPDEIERIALPTAEVHKTSRRDIPYVVTSKKNGALTVAATMIVAQWASIRFFATGGIGGVHRGSETSMDISADLEELAKTDVTVICAGAKSILDLGKTLEYLETRGVPVIGYQTNVLPAFYTRESDFYVDFRYDTPESIAEFLKTKDSLGLHGGTLICNPIPQEMSFPRHLIDEAIESALIEMNQLGIKGKETTPFLLKRIVDITGGKSLLANIALVYNNCALAADIAKNFIKGH